MVPNQGSGWVQEMSLVLLWVVYAQLLIAHFNLGQR
jgi:hypothetical protein